MRRATSSFVGLLLFVSASIVTPSVTYAAPPGLPEDFANMSPEQRVKAYAIAVQLADIAIKDGDHKSAVMYLEAMFPVMAADWGQLDKRTKMVAEILVKAYEGAGRTADAKATRDKYLDNAAAQQSDEAQALLGAAMAAYNEGRYEDAARDGEKAIQMISGASGGRDPNLGQYRHLLAGVYEELYRHGEAERLLVQNLQDAKAKMASDPMEAVTAIAFARQRLATHYIQRGSLREAEALAKKLLADASRVGGSNETAYRLLAHMISSGAAARREDNDAAYAEAKKMVQIAQGSGVDPAMKSVAMTFWASALSDKGEHEKALEIAGEVIKQRRAAGETDADMESALFGYALILRHAKRFDDAEAVLEKVLAIREAKYGANSPELHPTINWLTETRWARGDGPDVILPTAFRASDLKERGLMLMLASGSEEQRREFIKGYVDGTDRIITYDLSHARGDSQATVLATNTVLRRKGRILDAMTSEVQTRLAQASGDERQNLDELVRVRNQLATLSFRGPGQGVPPDAHAALIAQLESREEELQRELGSRVDLAAVTDSELITWERVRDRIPKDGVLVEIVQYRPFDVQYKSLNAAFGPPRYVAYVIRPGADAPIAVQLGDVATIDELVRDFRRAIVKRDNNVKDLARALDQRVFGPLEQHFGKAKHVFVSPDGQLNLASFGALVDKKGNYRLESYELTYLGSGRDLLRVGGVSAGSSGAVLVGDPDFDMGGGKGGDAGQRSTDLGSLRFGDLPGTEEEIDAVAKLLDDATVYTQADATEGRLRGIASPRILHVATHGFFLKDSRIATEKGRGLEIVDDDGDIAMPENPLLRSGIALAGANGRSDGTHDGIVTALELGSLDMRGTELVVLSACETGVGEVDPGEGVYGLRRSLVMAGAQSQVISLWQVDDEATRDLMIDFYKGLEKKKGRSEALRDAQRKLLKKKRTAHPYYWAAFIPSGQWAALGESAQEEAVAPEEGPKRPRRRRGGGGGGGFGDWMRESFDPDATVVLFGFDINRPMPNAQLDGVDFERKRGWGMSLDFTRRRRGMLGAGYAYQRIIADDHPLQPDARVHRLDFRVLVDILALPWDMKVRPALWGVANGGIAWGRDQLSDAITMSRDETRRIGGTIALGAEAGLTFRTKSDFAFGFRGGVTKPWVGLWDSGDLAPYMEAVNPLRWTVSIVMGTADE